MHQVAELFIDAHKTEEALSYWTKAAEKGDREAMRAILCRKTNDEAESFKWYSKLAELGDIGGKLNLAVLYRTGESKYYNPQKAFLIYEELGQAGHYGAFINLGRMCVEGIGIEKNEEKATDYFIKAAKAGAEKGDMQYWMYLGELYKVGAFLQKNLQKSLECYLEAAKRGEKKAIREVIHGYHLLGEIEKAILWDDKDFSERKN